jgi:hypothetical protein
MNPYKRAHARAHSRAILVALENHVASSATESLISYLRELGFNDGYIAASLLAGARL